MRSRSIEPLTVSLSERAPVDISRVLELPRYVAKILGCIVPAEDQYAPGIDRYADLGRVNEPGEPSRAPRPA